MPGLDPFPTVSPSGLPTLAPTGPTDAQLVIVGTSPSQADMRALAPLSGQPGRLIDQSLTKAGIARHQVRMLHVLPARVPGDDLARADARDLAWGRQQLEQELRVLDHVDRRLVILLGHEPLACVLGLHNIMTWRGSLWPPDSELTGDIYHDYWTRLTRADCIRDRVSDASAWAYMPTFHPSQVLTTYEWHIWLNNDLTRAKRWLDGNDYARHQRVWHIESPTETERLVYDVILPHEHLVAIDTEMSPQLVSLVTEDEVHVFVYSERYRQMLVDLVASPYVLKTAHNMAHDWRMFEKMFDIPVHPPYFDTICGAHIQEPSGMAAGDRDKSAGEQQVGKSLAPHLSTRYTGWPYHKWLADLDGYAYCGMDSVVGYDAYWQQMQELTPEQQALAAFDTRLFRVLFGMQKIGIRVDETARANVMASLRTRADMIEGTFVHHAMDVIRATPLTRLRKPHLFFQMRQCSCCNGGARTRLSCPACAGVPDTKRRTLADLAVTRGIDPSGKKVADLRQLLLGACQACQGVGKVEAWSDINMGSGAQIADLFYRALGVPARRFQGSETTRIEQLERLLDHGAYLDQMRADADDRRALARDLLVQYREWTYAMIEHDTAARITPDLDGRVRCVFDPWYTPTSRVASREGLLDLGTNLQNIPKEARKLLVPTEGYFMLYPDYRQVEGRALAVITQDQALLAEYARPDADSHQLVADRVTAAGTPITRDQAKRTFFATCYGVEAPHLASILGCSVSEAQTIITGILRAFPGVRHMRANLERELLATRGVTTLNGWTRRWLGYLLEAGGRKRGQVRDKVMKEALATKPQYMGARVLAEGLLQIDAAGHDWMYPIAHIHDASLVEARLERAADAIRTLESTMAVRAWDMDFPVDASAGPNWYVASLSDKEKVAQGYAAWTRASLLAVGAPGHEHTPASASARTPIKLGSWRARA